MNMPVAPEHADGLAASIEALFLPPVLVAVTDPTADYPPRFDSEAAAVANACAKRRREFFAGRAAVHQAMDRMGLPPAPVPTDRNRAPVWPVNLTGSISHNDTTCAAVLAETRSTPALGIDIEENTPLDENLIQEICTLPERAWLSTQPVEMRGRLAKLLFSAKECAYKCQFPLSRTILEFGDLEITTDLETGQFEATFTRSVNGLAKGSRLFGRYAVCNHTVITAIAADRHLAAPVLERRLHIF